MLAAKALCHVPSHMFLNFLLQSCVVPCYAVPGRAMLCFHCADCCDLDTSPLLLLSGVAQLAEVLHGMPHLTALAIEGALLDADEDWLRDMVGLMRHGR